MTDTLSSLELRTRVTSGGLLELSLEPAALLLKLAAAGKGFASIDSEKSAAA